MFSFLGGKKKRNLATSFMLSRRKIFKKPFFSTMSSSTRHPAEAVVLHFLLSEVSTPLWFLRTITVILSDTGTTNRGGWFEWIGEVVFIVYPSFLTHSADTWSVDMWPTATSLLTFFVIFLSRAHIFLWV